MKVLTHYKYKVQNKNHKSVTIIFPTEMESTVETITKSLFSTGNVLSICSALIHNNLVAEVGGFLGMILGVSLLDAEILITFMFKKFNH